ncbi:unnamed protein product, partial [Onchocerca ochengi]
RIRLRMTVKGNTGRLLDWIRSIVIALTKLLSTPLFI